jgi:hypothetical protein
VAADNSLAANLALTQNLMVTSPTLGAASSAQAQAAASYAAMLQLAQAEDEAA